MGYMPNIYVESPHTDLDMVHGCKASGNRDMSNIYTVTHTWQEFLPTDMDLIFFCNRRQKNVSNLISQTSAATSALTF
jgi:hypothetical protein